MMERGLSNRFTLISKIDIQRISSNLNIHRKEEADYVNNNDPFKNETKSYTMRSERIYLKDFKINMNFMAVDYEIGMRTLLHKWDNQRISFDTVLGFPAAIQGEGDYDVANPSLKLEVSYARNFDFYNLKGNFFEMMIASKSNPKVKKKELFFTVILGLKLSKQASLILAFENNHLYKNSFERYVFTNIYKKVTTQNIDEELKEKLKSHIEEHSLFNEKKLKEKSKQK